MACRHLDFGKESRRTVHPNPKHCAVQALTLIVTLSAFLGNLSRAQVLDNPQPTGLMRWLNPSTAPFIPIPEIDVDPNSGTTLGIIPTWLFSDERSQIRKIIAPDVIYNPNFGVGARARMYSYPSDDTQWSIDAGGKQHVESEFDLEYQTGRLRDTPWSYVASAVYDRSGTPRFYGTGNETLHSAETNYTLRQKYLQMQVGWNISHTLQLSYTLRARSVEVQPGTLAHIDSIEDRYPAIRGLGVGHETLHRLSLTYDSRDDTTVPTRGTEVSLYGGIAAARGIVNDSLYSVAGIDARRLWTPLPGNTIVTHLALRYMPRAITAPFWSLSSLGGDESLIGDAQPLRGFGSGRFHDRNSLSASFEYRKRVLSVAAMGTNINLEITPFVDVGEVFARASNAPLSKLHKVGGIGFRGVASPFVVGYVDIGYGSEGAAVFTGINYPF